MEEKCENCKGLVGRPRNECCEFMHKLLEGVPPSADSGGIIFISHKITQEVNVGASPSYFEKSFSFDSTAIPEGYHSEISICTNFTFYLASGGGYVDGPNKDYRIINPFNTKRSKSAPYYFKFDRTGNLSSINKIELYLTEICVKMKN